MGCDSQLVYGSLYQGFENWNGHQIGQSTGSPVLTVQPAGSTSKTQEFDRKSKIWHKMILYVSAKLGAICKTWIDIDQLSRYSLYIINKFIFDHFNRSVSIVFQYM